MGGMGDQFMGPILQGFFILHSNVITYHSLLRDRYIYQFRGITMAQLTYHWSKGKDD